MPSTTYVAVKDLQLDLENFRTTPQPDEKSAVHAMITIEPKYFWGLMESIIRDGVEPTENIIVLKAGLRGENLIVKEGNRRTAVLRICHGLIPRGGFDIPDAIEQKIVGLSADWKKANSKAPCVVYEPEEADAVDRIVARVHGKGDAASRAEWKAVATARHNRNALKQNEPALDLLEKFLAGGKVLTGIEKEMWAGDYPLTVLDDAIKRLAPRLGKKNASEIAASYPNIPKFVSALDDIMLAIGRDSLGYDRGGDDGRGVRSTDFGVSYGIPQNVGGAGGTPGGTTSGAPATAGGSGGSGASGSSGGTAGTGGGAGRKALAYPNNDPRAVKAALKKFKVRGQSREKVATLTKELTKIDMEDAPHGFCFTLRSAFEISAHAYADDHPTQISKLDKKGAPKNLKELLTDVAKHLSLDPGTGKPNPAKQRIFHGATMELGKSSGILSVTSMNSLVHSRYFSVDASNICTVFGNIFPLLQAMNS